MRKNIITLSASAISRRIQLPYYLWMLGVIATMFFAGCKPFSHHPRAQHGFLDLSAWDFAKDGPIKLDGEWEFYWGKLYAPADFSGDTLPVRTGYIRVPGYWNFQDITMQRLPRFGYGTYRLRIKKDTANKLMGIKVLDQNSAYKLWVNDKLVAGEGVVGTNAREEKPRLLPVIRVFESGGEMQVVVQVSNFFAYRSGIGLSMTIGTQADILQARDFNAILSMCLLGCFLILSIYHLFIFFLRRTEYITLWFGLLCLSLSLRSLLIDEKFLYELVPSLDVHLGLRLEYETLWIAGLFLGLFVQSLFPKEFDNRAMKVIIWLSIIEMMIIFTTSSIFYTSLLICYQFKALFELCYYFFVTVRAMIRRRRAAKILFMFMVILAFAGVNDMLYSNLVINTTFLLSYGGFFILVAQAYLIARRLSYAYDSVEKLSVELNTANISLEQKVTMRTQELESAMKNAESERGKADNLLLNILPEKTAEELKATGRSDPRMYSMTTVMFIDMVGFTRISEHMGAELLVAEIDACFSAFDKIIEECGVEKIKTIGDAYLCAAGLPVPNTTHASDILQAAIRIREFMELRRLEKEQRGDVPFLIRIGINTGPLVAGIVGIKKFAYDIWGDTVNTAARMEQNCEPGHINISSTTYDQVKGKFRCTYRGKIEAKNKGMIDMYYVQHPLTPVT